MVKKDPKASAVSKVVPNSEKTEEEKTKKKSVRKSSVVRKKTIAIQARLDTENQSLHGILIELDVHQDCFLHF